MVRFGVIGTNRITEKWIQDAQDLADFTLSAVYSRTEDKAKEFACKFDIPHTYTDLTSMALSKEIDAVYIASPNALHAEQAILMMKHGKHVLCEKAIASNIAELKAMIETANKHQVVLMEAMKSTLLPNFQAITEHLPKIGKVRRYVASYCQYSSRYDAYKEGTILNAFKPELSNGSLMDIGVYCIYPLMVLFGEPVEVKANAYMLESGVDGEGSLLLAYKDMEAVIFHSKIASSYLPSEIQGEDGTILIEGLSEMRDVEIRYRDGRVEKITRPQVNETMRYETKEFITVIREGRLESAINSHANSLATMRVMQEARRQIGLIFPADQRQSAHLNEARIQRME